VRIRGLGRWLVGFTFVVVVGIALDAAPVAASSNRPVQSSLFEHVRRWDSAVVIESNGSVTITHTIDLDFADSEHHGIERSLRSRYRYDTRRRAGTGSRHSPSSRSPRRRGHPRSTA